MVYTLDKLRTFVRSIDTRVKDVSKYPDAWVDERIESGMAIAEETYPIFSTKEEYNVYNDFMVDGLDEIEIILQQEVHAVHEVICDENFFELEIMPNNHIRLKRKEDVPPTDDWSVVVRYFFYPVMPIEDIEMSMNMYRFVKHAISVEVFSKLFDRENEQYHQAILDSMTVRTAFDIEKDLSETPEERLWSGTWV